LNEQISCVLLILLVIGRVKGSWPTVYNFRQRYILFWATQVCLAQYYKD